MDVTSVHMFDQVEQAVTAAQSREKLFKDASFRSQMFEKLDRLIPAERSVLSLDIFDTLVIRDNSAELERFIDIGGAMADTMTQNASDKKARWRKSGLPSRSAIDAFLARHLGTKASYRARDRVKGHGEGSLTEIHTVSSRLLSGDVRHKDAFVDVELAYEATRIKPNRMILDYVGMHLGRGGKVILVTDMYMHAAQVEKLLRLVGIDTSRFTAIFSSADECISKASGLIFPMIEGQMELRAGDFVHVGDSLRGDFQKPISQGWKALHLPVAAAEVAERRSSHLSAAEMLRQNFAIEVDIAMPS